MPSARGSFAAADRHQFIAGHIAARHDEGVLPPAALDLQAEAIIPPGSRLPPLLPSTHDDLDDAVARDIAHRAIVPLVTAPAR